MQSFIIRKKCGGVIRYTKKILLELSRKSLLQSFSHNCLLCWREIDDSYLFHQPIRIRAEENRVLPKTPKTEKGKDNCLTPYFHIFSFGLIVFMFFHCDSLMFIKLRADIAVLLSQLNCFFILSTVRFLGILQRDLLLSS